MKSKPLKKPSKKLQQIVETAKSLFIQHGIKRITIEEICQTAKVSKMTFYKFFRDKTKLVKYLYESWFQESMDKFKQINALAIPFSEKIERMFAWKVAAFKEISFECIEEIIPLKRSHEKTGKFIFQVISEAQKKGEVRQEVRPEFLLAVIDKMWELAQNEDLRKLYATPLDYNREIKDFFYYGIIPGKAPKKIN